MTLLAIAPADDEHLLAVAARLRARGEHLTVLDLARLPGAASATVELERAGPARFTLSDGARSVDGAAVTAVWWWRPAPLVPAAPADPTAGEDARDAARATAAVLASTWHALPSRWVNDPVREEVASRKPFQLAVARQAGLQVPRTLVTADPDRARAFLASVGRDGALLDAVVKPVAPVRAARLYTRRLRTADLDGLEAIRAAPVVLQEYVDGVDLRVTVVGRELFAMEVDARRSAHPEDCRRDPSIRPGARAAAIPAEVGRRLLAVMDRLGLAYGAFDLRRSEDGEHLFLEVNPAGQWLFAEEATGHPITAAVARLLAGDGPGT